MAAEWVARAQAHPILERSQPASRVPFCFPVIFLCLAVVVLGIRASNRPRRKYLERDPPSQMSECGTRRRCGTTPAFIAVVLGAAGDLHHIPETTSPEADGEDRGQFRDEDGFHGGEPGRTAGAHRPGDGRSNDGLGAVGVQGEPAVQVGRRVQHPQQQVDVGDRRVAAAASNGTAPTRSSRTARYRSLGSGSSTASSPTWPFWM